MRDDIESNMCGACKRTCPQTKTPQELFRTENGPLRYSLRKLPRILPSSDTWVCSLRLTDSSSESHALTDRRFEREAATLQILERRNKCFIQDV
jgi:hypothetical protein